MNKTEAAKPRWRQVTSMLLVVLASLLAPLALTAIWLNIQIRDTDRYVETVAPLSRDDTVAEAVSQRLTYELFQSVDVEQSISEALPQEASFLAGPLNGRIEAYTQEIIKDFIKSDGFNRLWVEANRVSHAAITGVVLGEGGIVQSENGRVSLDLNPALADVKLSLSDAGVDLFDDMSTNRVDLEYTLFQSQQLAEIQDAVGTLERLTWMLPLLILASWSGAVWLAPDRRRMVLFISIGLSLSMALLLLLLTIARSSLLDSSTAGGGSADVVAVLYDTLLRTPITAARWLFLLGFVTAAVSWLVWPAGFMVRARAAIRRWSEGIATNSTLGPLFSWITLHRRVLQLSGTFVVLLVLVMTQWPSLRDVLILGLILAAYLALIELTARVTLAAGRDSDRSYGYE